jgi:hypothetical protein
VASLDKLAQKEKANGKSKSADYLLPSFILVLA